MGLIRAVWAPTVAWALLALGGCSPAALLSATVPSDGATVTSNVPYAAGPRHTLDIYHPAHPNGPLVVFIYGGGWKGGNKDSYPFVARPLAARGAVVVVPDYRVYPETQFPGFLQDNAAAVAWAIAHAAELGADPLRVFVMGHSAGGYDVAMLATDPRLLEAAGTSRDRLAGVIGLAGPYDFLPSSDPDVYPVFGAANTPANEPTHFVDGRNPPLFLAAGSDDTTVMPRNTTTLAARVTERGGRVETRLYPGIGHIGLITAFAPLFAGRAPVLDDAWAFIERNRAAYLP